MLQEHIQKLDHIHTSLSTLTKNIVVALNHLVDALEQKDIAHLKPATKNINGITTQCKQIDNEILTSLALFGAEASDLRKLIAYLKITNEIVRIAQNLKSFSKRVNPLLKHSKAYDDTKNFTINLSKSTSEAVNLIDKMLHASNNEQILDLYAKVQVEEDKSDVLYSVLEKNVILFLSNEFLVDYMKILSMMRKLERIADRASAISKLLVFANIGGELDVY